MYLSKLIIDPFHPQGRRDLADAYEMHRTLCRAFAPVADTRPQRFLWRCENGADPTISGGAVVLVQSAQPGDWQPVLAQHGYAQGVHPNKKVDLAVLVRAGRRYHFRVTTNPTVTRAGKRYGLVQEDAQRDWLVRQGERCGFRLLEVVRSNSQRLVVKQGKKGHRITVQTVRFEGVLEATNAEALSEVLLAGIGHAKAFGLGMLSLAPVGP